MLRTTFDVDLDADELLPVQKKQQTVNNFNKDDYVTERVWCTSHDGVQVAPKKKKDKKTNKRRKKRRWERKRERERERESIFVSFDSSLSCRFQSRLCTISKPSYQRQR